MKVCMIIPPKVEGLYVHREDKHVSMHKEPFVPYTAPLHYGLIAQEIENVELSLIEAQRDDLELEDVLKKLDEINPDIVVTYFGWISIPWDRKVAETKYPTIVIIVQQWLDQMEAVKLYTLKNKYTLFKEIEAPLIESLKEYQVKGKIEDAAGVIIENNGQYNLTSMPNLFDMKTLPMPDFKAFKLEKYFELRAQTIPGNREKMAFLNTMKSCPFQCSFCGQSNDGTKVRYQTAEYVVKQMKYLNDEYGIVKFEFIDNVYTTSKRRAKEIAEKIIESGLNIKYSINDRLGRYDKELAELLKKSGCFEVRVGIEAIDPKVQEFLNKKLDLEVGKEQLQIIHDAGIVSYLYFTPGVPGESTKSLDMNAKFISDVNSANFTAGPLFIMPGSPLYSRFKKEGKILEEDWSEYRRFNKLSYINESYKDMDAIMDASKYMTKKTYFYNIRRWDRGFKYVSENLIKYLSTVTTINKVVPQFIKNKIYTILSKR